MRWLEKVGYGLTSINKMETVKTKVLQYRDIAGYSDEPTGVVENEDSSAYGEPTYDVIWSEWKDVPTVTDSTV